MKSRVIPFFKQLFKFIKKIFQEFGQDNCMIRASSLTFISLIALVPLSALLLSLFSAFGAFEHVFENIQEFLISQIFPTMQSQFTVYLKTFVENARSLGILGLVFFILTSILLLNNINSNFNAVWGSRSRKTVMDKFATYVSVLFVGSILIGAGFSLSTMLQSASQTFQSHLSPTLITIIYSIIPRFFTFFTFLLMIMLIPSSKVKFFSALIGAAVGLVCWEIAKYLFVFATSSIIQMSKIYGSFAIIPLFLIWLYVAWGIMLFSLEVAYVHQHKGKRWVGKSYERLLPSGQIFLGVRIFLFIANAFFERDKPPGIRDLSEEFSISETETAFFIQRFTHFGLLMENRHTQKEYSPAISLDSISLSEVVSALTGGADFQSETFLDERARRTVLSFLRHGLGSLDERSVLELIKSTK